ILTVPKPPDRPTCAVRWKKAASCAPVSFATPASSWNTAFRPPPRSSEPRTPQRLVDCVPCPMIRALRLLSPRSITLTEASTMPYIVTFVCAWANAGSAATTAAAISDFFIDQSPKFLESIGSLHAAATPRAWLLPIPGLKSKSFSPKSMGTQSSARPGGPKSCKPVVWEQQASARPCLRKASPRRRGASRALPPGALAPQWNRHADDAVDEPGGPAPAPGGPGAVLLRHGFGAAHARGAGSGRPAGPGTARRGGGALARRGPPGGRAPARGPCGRGLRPGPLRGAGPDLPHGIRAPAPAGGGARGGRPSRLDAPAARGARRPDLAPQSVLVCGLLRPRGGRGQDRRRGEPRFRGRDREAGRGPPERPPGRAARGGCPLAGDPAADEARRNGACGRGPGTRRGPPAAARPGADAGLRPRDDLGRPLRLTVRGIEFLPARHQ